MAKFDFVGSFLGKRAQLKKDGHDMSSLECMSIPFGVNTPIASVFCVPNEHYKGTLKGATQTAPMREDNFASIYSNQKAVFVPMSSVMRNYLDLTDASRSTRKDKFLDFPSYDARVDYRTPMSIAFWQYSLSRLCSAFIAVVPNYADYVFNADGTGNEPYWELFPGDTSLKDLFNPYSNVFELTDLSLGCRFFEIISNVSRLTYAGGTSLSFVIDFVRNLTSAAGTPWYMDFLRISDSLGYGNLYPHFDSCFCRLTTFYQYNFTDIFQIHSDGYFKLRDDSPSATQIKLICVDSNESKTMEGFKNLSLFPLLCYQYYIQMVERANYRSPLTTIVTWDSILDAYTKQSQQFFTLTGDQLILFNNTTTSSSWGNFCHYFNTFSRDMNQGKQYDVFKTTKLIKDFYISDFLFYFWSLNNPLLPSDLFTSSQLSVVQGSVPTVSTASLNSNLIQAYADTSALYKLRQDLLRAGVRRDKQMQSIFGVSGDQHVTERVYILDDTQTNVNIQGLLNQAETDQAPLGARASRGNGSFGLSFKLDTEDFGYLFIVQSFTCSVFYENFMIDRSNSLLAQDWWMPQYNHLGLEAIRSNQLSFAERSNFKSEFNSFSTSDSVVGFSSRDWHLKTRLNKVHGAFSNYGLADNSPSMRAVHHGDLPAPLARGNAPFGGFVPTVIEQQVDKYAHDSSLYYRPDMANNLFVNMVDGALYGDYSFDQFRNAYSFSLHKVSPMPKIGLLRLDV